MKDFNGLAFGLFLVIVAITLIITYWAAKRTHTTSEFYAAGASIPGWQNGIAIAGDYMSAASFLGIAGMIALSGYDGFMYSVGWLVAYLTVLLLVAEPLRNTGKYTMADVLASRLNEKPVRSVAALSTIVISTFYMIAQMVGAGGLIKLLLGIPYNWAIIIVGTLMVLYVVFGGMLATTWVQITKAVLLMGGTIVLSILVLSKFNFNVGDMFDKAASMYGTKFLEPGLRFTNPLDQISLGLALVLGTAGMPHILMRFYTVPNAKEARKSTVWAMWIIGSFYVMTTFLGFGAAILVGKEAILAVDKGGNMAAPLLAKALGGDFMMAFIAAVAFATILAVVAGLTIAASSAFAHDFYTNVIRGGKATEQEQIKVARITAFVVGILAIIIGIAANGMNVAYMVALAFAVASSANLPVILLTVFWKRFTTTGAVVGMLVGLVSALLFTFIGQGVMGKNAIFPMQNPGIVSIPLGFLAAIIGSLIGKDQKAEEKFSEIYVRANTGYGVDK
ncbi:solute symporter family protein [Effusibacillus lacus]|uniref:Cation acetate symporter n=1 Tax=Effusibacillus lacus TaxID=1348429 RepID=A0A292YSV6_9BACL|nr:cation acetate symporter [Effusibacillus lacus]TCS74890.1 cation/acetate symporter [Effusibacillus lacus]GAX91565.1 cation acetate symporter [Effusibacillus lacus]